LFGDLVEMSNGLAAAGDTRAAMLQLALSREIAQELFVTLKTAILSGAPKVPCGFRSQ
jgi:hypothetical protein